MRKFNELAAKEPRLATVRALFALNTAETERKRKTKSRKLAKTRASSSPVRSGVLMQILVVRRNERDKE